MLRVPILPGEMTCVHVAHERAQADYPLCRFLMRNKWGTQHDAAFC